MKMFLANGALLTPASYPYYIGADGTLYDGTGRRVHTEMPYRMTQLAISVWRDYLLRMGQNGKEGQD